MKHGIYSVGTPNLLILLQNARKKEVNQILFRVLKNWTEVLLSNYDLKSLL